MFSAHFVRRKRIENFMRKDVSIETAVREAMKQETLYNSTLFTFKYAVLPSDCQVFFY
jgi:hypothetical protein